MPMSAGYALSFALGCILSVLLILVALLVTAGLLVRRRCLDLRTRNRVRRR